ncbi:carboxypeptidase-like regulatory domain-containing protein [Rubrivirga sp. IMCC43871]|uniref:carboxypeptidase-like regulatory domain-containing protein n=1 Tax=Rubrivirga sp. IMCC43871 TaxID=3391575 RepID=UPI00398FE652
MRSIALVLLALVSLAGCKDGLVEPERFGSIEGSVFNFETGEAIPRASVTTSPATDAITVGDDGQFVFQDVLTGAYTLTASKNGFNPNTVTVQVRDGRTAQAALFLRPETDEENPTGVEFAAEVLGFVNEPFSRDSSFVTVEYRAINNGDVPIAEYEIYFRIDTDRGPFYQEVTGTELLAGERDLATFRKRLLGASASVVVIEDTVAE